MHEIFTNYEPFLDFCRVMHFNALEFNELNSVDPLFEIMNYNA
jgi:hypothetical protein